jgi:glyoxylase-like metal-dependent hydrolase (beta-lactamase superfamily II)
MNKLRSVLAAVSLLPIACVAGAEAATLDDVAKAMGASRLDSVSFSGAGTFFAVGQNFRPTDPWPRFELTQYVRAADYAGQATRLDFALMQGENPPRGGGTQPIIGTQRRGSGASGDTGWVMAQGVFTAASTTQGQHDLWITPHGIVKAAIADGAKVTGSQFEIVRAGRFLAKATVDGQNRVAKVESWIDNPVLGDMAVVTEYRDYKDFAGVSFPSRILQSAGGHPVLDLTVTEVKSNAGVVTVPTAIVRPSAEVTAEKAAEGVWFLAGGTHHSVAIEMQDHIVLIEAPLGDARSSAAIEAAKKAIPGKPVRYVVNTHHHFDHSGGLRAAAAEGAIVVTHAMNKPYFEQAYAAPRKIAPDRLAKAGGSAKFETFADKHVLSDAKRVIELHLLAGATHNAGLTISYLPADKILIVADAFSPRQQVTKTPDQLNPFTVNLWDNIKRLGLDVQTILPIHGRMVKADELRIEVGATN